ncbi:MAG: arylsulfatase A-like enzyme, partial [Chlamydiales bacterium]
TWPIEHGILANYRFTGIPYRPSDRIQSLASFLTERGYSTGGFISALPLKSTFGISTGFQTYDDPEDTQRPAADTTDVALAWLEQLQAGPFFMWVHYFDPHIPLEPPAPFDTRFGDGPDLQAHLEERQVTMEAPRTTGGTHNAVEGMNLYDGEVAYADQEVGRLLDNLRQRPDWERTIVVLLGDHGEGLNQHGEPGHGLTWEEHLRVPFLLRLPDTDAGRIPYPVSLADVLPTLLGVLDLEREDELMEQVSGVDVLATDFQERPILSQSSDRQQRYEAPASYTLTEGRWKYARFETGEERVFDLDADPFELTNLVSSQPEIAKRLRAELARILEAQRERGEFFGEGRLEAQHRYAERLKRKAMRALSESELEAMKALGYGGNDDD